MRFLSCLFAVAFSVVFATPVAAQADRRLPYQGTLEFNGDPVTADVEMEFALFATASGGSALWTHTQTVPVASGSFSVVLGEQAALPDAVVEQARLYLEVRVAGQLLNGRQPLFAAHQLADPPGEFRAGSVNTGPVDATSVVADSVDTSSLTTGRATLNDTTGGALGWNVVMDIHGPHGALRHVGGNVLYGLHGNGSFYWLNTENDLYAMWLNRDGTLNVRNTVQTPSIQLANTSAIRGIQSGEDGVSCASNAGQTTSGTVTFPVAFANKPIVTVTPYVQYAGWCTQVRLTAVSTSGFTWQGFGVGSTNATPCGCVHWMAIDQ